MLKGYLTIELTYSKIRYIYLGRDHQKYKVLKSGVISQPLNVHAQGELSRTVQELIRREEISPIRIFVTVCLQDNFIRQVDVPRTNLSKLEEELSEEITKSPVFNKRKFDYIYNVVFKGYEQGNLVFAAIDQNVLDYILSECGSLGLPFSHLEIAPLNLKEVFPLIDPGGDNHTVLFINDQVSYLMMSQKGQWRLISRSTIGIDHLYPLKNDKINYTYFINLAGDLQRVIKSYISQHKIEKLDKLWILWDQHGASGLASALAGKLSIDIQVLNLERFTHFDLGLEGKSANPMDVLCVTPAVIFFERIKEQFPLNHFFRAQQYKAYVIKWLAGALLVLGLAGYALGVKGQEYYRKEKKLGSEIAVFMSKIDQLDGSKKDIHRRRDEAMQIRQGLIDQAKYIDSLNRAAWSQALTVFIKEMPKDMSLTSFKFDETGHASFSGESLEVTHVTELVRRLENSDVFEQGLVDSFTENQVSGQKVFVFRIVARLNDTGDSGKK